MVGKFAKYASLVYGGTLLPDLLALLDPSSGGEAGDYYFSGLDVGAFEGGDGDGAVDVALLVEGSAERAGHGGGVADEEQQGVGGGHHGLDGLVDFLADALGFVDDDEYVGAVEALELVCAVGGEAEGVAVVGEVPAGVQHLAAEGLRGGTVEAANLPPEDVAHLPEGGRSAEGDGAAGVGVDEPEQGDGGAEALAKAVASLDGDAAMLGEGVEHLGLLGPQLDAEDLAGEGDGGGQRRTGRPLALGRRRDDERAGAAGVFRQRG